MTDGSGTTTHSYDDAGRLTTVTPPSPAAAINYTWDDNGNLDRARQRLVLLGLREPHDAQAAPNAWPLCSVGPAATAPATPPPALREAALTRAVTFGRHSL